MVDAAPAPALIPHPSPSSLVSPVAVEGGLAAGGVQHLTPHPSPSRLHHPPTASRQAHLWLWLWLWVWGGRLSAFLITTPRQKGTRTSLPCPALPCPAPVDGKHHPSPFLLFALAGARAAATRPRLPTALLLPAALSRPVLPCPARSCPALPFPAATPDQLALEPLHYLLSPTPSSTHHPPPLPSPPILSPPSTAYGPSLTPHHPRRLFPRHLPLAGGFCPSDSATRAPRACPRPASRHPTRIAPARVFLPPSCALTLRDRLSSIIARVPAIAFARVNPA